MIYRVGSCTIDTQTYEVRQSGRRIFVEPQVFDLLVLLLSNSHRLVTKDEIIAAIWNGRIISEAALSSRIAAARKAIGDDGKVQALIRTVQRRGFRFVGALATEPSESGIDLAAAKTLNQFDKQAVTEIPPAENIADPRENTGRIIETGERKHVSV